MLKKTISLALIAAIISCLFAAAAASAEENVTVREGAMYAVIYENPEYPTRGKPIEEISDNYTTANSILIEDIKNLTYAEINTFEPNRLDVGLPYDAVEKVESIPYVERVELIDPLLTSELTPDEKMTDGLKTYIAAHSGERMDLRVSFLYDKFRCFIGEDKTEFDDPDDYLLLRQTRRNDFCMETNQKGFDRIAETVDAELIELFYSHTYNTITINIPVDDVMTVARMNFVGSLKLPIEEDPSEAPTDSPTEPPTESPQLLADKFESWMAEQWIDKAESDDAPILYGEIVDYREYRELAVNSDWALIQAHVTGISSGWELRFSKVYGDRVLSDWEAGADAYPLGLFIYNAEKDQFFAIEATAPEDYPGLTEKLDELNIGRPLGDADQDNNLTILDATAIQRHLADIMKLPEDDKYFLSTLSNGSRSFADADCDGTITVLDATKVQRSLAGLK